MIINVYKYNTKYRNVRYTTFPPLLEKMYVIGNKNNDENWMNTQDINLTFTIENEFKQEVRVLRFNMLHLNLEVWF